jgi:ribose 5-phosphate isomerase B
MRIAVGSDHAGYEPPPPLYKPELIAHIKALGHEVIDCGTDSSDPVDYPDFANAVCERILNGEADFGVLVCGTGVGVAIAANRHKGIRAAVCLTPEMAKVTREHNDANIVTMGRRLVSLPVCMEIIDTFLSTPFSGQERHARRVAKMG